MRKLSFFPLFILVSSVLFAASATQARAEEVDAIYFVDMQRVINESIIGKAAKSDLEAEVKKREAGLAKLQGDFKALRADVEKQASLLSAEALKGKQDAVEKKGRELERAMQDQREELTKKNNEAVGKVVQEVDAVISELAKDKGYKMIMEKDARLVVYADKSLDLSDEIIKTLDSKKVSM